MRFLFAIMISLIISSASSQELALVGHGFSYHATNSNNYNQDNYGIGLRLQNANLAAQVGTYRNSYNQITNYLVLDLNLLSNSIETLQFEFGPMLAIATGYPGYSLLIIPGLQTAIFYNNFYLRARIAPALSTPAVAAIEFGYVFYRF